MIRNVVDACRIYFMIKAVYVLNTIDRLPKRNKLRLLQWDLDKIFDVYVDLKTVSIANRMYSITDTVVDGEDGTCTACG